MPIFDAKAAERPIRFIESYCCNFVDKWAGKPFILMDWQKELIRQVYGTIDQDTGIRAYNQTWLEIAKGSGKSPLLAAIGVYELLASEVRGPEVYSIACDSLQARITFDTGQKIITASPKLFELVKAGKLLLRQFTTEYLPNNGEWRLLAGTAEGRHGMRPSCVLFDEVHEQGNHRGLFDAMQTNAAKRDNSVIWCATNSGSTKDSLCWDIHVEAKAVLDGTRPNSKMLPVVYAAPRSDPIDDPATWRKANPSIGTTISLEAVAAEAERAKHTPHAEARFRRFFLSQWVSDAGRWLDMDQWDKCTSTFSTKELVDAPCFCGLDLSLNDDLSALAIVWLKDNHLYVKFRQWVPAETAKKYESRDGVPFTQWQTEKAVTLLDTATVDDRCHRRIAGRVKKLAMIHKINSVAYDRYKATRTISIIEKAGIPCIAVKQTIDVLSPACFELERRLKEGTITIYPSGCARWQASNVEVIADNNGLIRPVKQNRKAGYAGTKGLKIDAIAALVTALTQVVRVQIASEGPATSLIEFF
jgi:phage terminase large subunit-like protein